MPVFNPPVRDMQFILHEVLDLAACAPLPGFADLTPEVIDSILEGMARFCIDVAAPLNQTGDAQGCTWREGVVTTPQGFQEAYRIYASGGWQGLHASPRYGGHGLPGVIGWPLTEMSTAANWGFTSYPGLTTHAITPVERFASDELKALYLPKMVSGEWSATMNLTEPHCGSDLGLLRTRAVPDGDGSYRLTGTKIFITAGEHDLTENIVHLVLARREGAPSGVRGISLFIVPKFIPDPAGRPGQRNSLRCARIEEKMGIHSSATCELVYEDAVGWLVGEPERGLAAMFTMMNEARLAAGLQGVAIAEVAYQNAVAYARQRLQGQAPGSTGPQERGADPIILHPDVRRMLLEIRCFAEGGRALAYWTGLQADLAGLHPDEAVRRRASRIVDVMTPIIKAYFTEQGVEGASLAMQCLGGHGYIRSWGIEQFMRDARIGPLYEGANGVQAMDLVARKLMADGGQAIAGVLECLGTLAATDGSDPDAVACRRSLDHVFGLAREASRLLQEQASRDPGFVAAVAHDYLCLLALLSMGCIWARMDDVARQRSDQAPQQLAFYEAKRQVARYFFSRVLPGADAFFTRIRAGGAPVLGLAVDAF